MIRALGNWIITICIAIFFATAVQMILPDNSLKKYCNFVIGLIVFVVMVTPIINLINRDIPIDKLIEQSTLEVFSDTTKVDYSQYRDSNISTTIDVFKSKLEKQCEEDLNTKFSADNYKVSVNVFYDENDSIFVIDSMDITMDDGSVEVVKPIIIGDEISSMDKKEEDQSEKTLEIKRYISSRYDIDEKKIHIYKSKNNNSEGE